MDTSSSPLFGGFGGFGCALITGPDGPNATSSIASAVGNDRGESDLTDGVSCVGGLLAKVVFECIFVSISMLVDFMER